MRAGVPPEVEVVHPAILLAQVRKYRGEWKQIEDVPLRVPVLPQDVPAQSTEPQ